MTISYNPFDIYTMMGVVERFPHFPGLFKELFFSRRNALETNTVELELVVGGKEVIPVVSEVSRGKVVDATSRESRIVKAPRLRPKLPYSGVDLLKEKVPGTAPSSPGAPMDRVEAKLAADLKNLDDRLELTYELYCAMALTGEITLSGEDAKVHIDYLMPAGNKLALSGTALWSDPGADPEGQFEDWYNVILEASSCGMDTVVLGTNAWKHFRDRIADKLDNRRLDVGELSPRVKSLYKGNVNGVDIYVYGGTYQEDGVAKQLLHPDYAVAGSRSSDNSIEFGLPNDLKCPGPCEKFVKTYEENDPSALFVLMESRPVPLPKNPGAFMYNKVV